MYIKVFIQIQKFKGGPAIFRDRLIKSLNRFDDIEVVTDINKKFDIELAFIRKVFKHNKPYILRASSCYYFKNYKPWNNKPIARAIGRSNYSIFQSKFAYKLLNRVLRLESRNLIKHGYSVIYNGIDLDYINKIEPNKNIEPGSFITCARWDPNKRPLSTIKGFLEADIKKHLYIVGEKGVEGRGKNLGKKYEKNKYIHFLGEKNNQDLISIMKACNYQMHLSFIDICPNIVLEGLSCRLNVLCTNLGGTKELVREDGYILEVDKMWDGKYLSSSIKLDAVDKKKVASGIHKLLQLKTKPDISRYDISNVAQQYVNIIRNSV